MFSMKVYQSIFVICIVIMVILALAIAWEDISATIKIISCILVGIYFLLLLSRSISETVYLYYGVILLVWSLSFFPNGLSIPVFMGIFFFLFQSSDKLMQKHSGKLLLQVLSIIPILIFQFTNILLLSVLFLTHVLVWLLYTRLQMANVSADKMIDTLKKDILAKDKILATLAHELRTPLTVITTATHILLEGRTGKINPQQRKFLFSTQENAERMTDLIEDILMRVRIEHIWFGMDKKKCDLRSLVRKVCKNMEPLILEKKQYIRYLYPNLLSYVMVDTRWVEQVLVNLIHNSSKHLGENGQILVSIKENEQYVLVSVSDNGLGIKQDERKKVFSEYYRGEFSGKQNAEGVGLGLSIAQDVIERHKGKMYLSSVEGVGTVFTFTLPKV